MTCCRNIAVHIAVAAVGASMRGVALFYTGRSSNHGSITMPGCADNFCFVVVTVFAIVAFLAILGAGCVFNSVPLAISMTCCRNIAVHIAVATVGAGVGGATLLGAGGSSDHSSITMPGCANDFCFVVVTVFAIVPLLTIFGAGCVFNGVPFTISMTCCRNIAVNVAVTTVCADVGGVTLLRTGGCSYGFGVAMTSCADNFCFVVVTVFAIVAFLAILGAGSILDSVPFTVSMTCCRNIAVHIAVAAVCAGVSRVALFCTGRGSNHSVAINVCIIFATLFPNSIQDCVRIC